MTMFEEMTFENILQMLLDDVKDDLDKREGSVIYNAIAPAAGKFSMVYMSMFQTLMLGFVQKSADDYLDLITESEGVKRNLATPSVRHFRAGGASGQITAGDRFFVDDVYFVATENIQIPGTFRAESEATGAGTAIRKPETLLPLDTIEGLETLEMIDHPDDIDGIDRESDDALRRRFWEKVENSPGPGNNADYIRWAKEITGVGNVLVDPLWKGANTVRLVILTPEGRRASDALIEEVQELIDPGRRGRGEGKAPPGAKVTVTTADLLRVDAVIPNLTAESGYTAEQVRENARNALAEYLQKINPGGVIRVREAESEIINAPGVLDMGDLTLNGRRENMLLDVVQLATVGEVSFP